LDNRLNVVNEIRQAPEDVLPYLKDELKELLKDNMIEGISCHLSPFSQGERFSMLKEKIINIIR
jgi:hypothetical protein